MINYEGKKLVACHRVSTKKQGKSGLGLKAQKMMITSYADMLKAEVIKTFVDVEDANKIEYSRTELKKAIKLVKENEDHFLIVAKHDRLTRDSDIAVMIFNEIGGRLILCDNIYEVLTKNKLHEIYIHAAKEKEYVSKRTKAALKAKLEYAVKSGKGVKQNKAGKPSINGTLFHKKKLDYKPIVHAMSKARTVRALDRNKDLITLVQSYLRAGDKAKEIMRRLNKTQIIKPVNYTQTPEDKYKAGETYNFKHINQIYRLIKHVKTYEELGNQ